VHMDDIMIIGDDKKGTDSLNKYLQKYFQTKNLESLKHFLGIVVTGSKKGILLSQKKYVLDFFSEAARMQEY